MKKYVILLCFSFLLFFCQFNKTENQHADISLAKWEVYKGLYNFIEKHKSIRCGSRKDNYIFLTEQSYRCPELIPSEIYIADYLKSELELESKVNKGDTTVYHFSIVYDGKCIIPLCPIDSPNAVGVYDHKVVYIGFDSSIFVDSFDEKEFILYILENKKRVNNFLYKQAIQRHHHPLQAPKSVR